MMIMNAHAQHSSLITHPSSLIPHPWFRLILFVLGILTLMPGTALSVQIMDDMGHELTLQEPAKRVIPLYGAFAEMLYAIGAGKEVVARTQADQFPPEIVKLPSVGTHMRPNEEMIIGLK